MFKQIKQLIDLFRCYKMTAVQYARHIGVNMGEDNFISGKNHWSSEPYLITIGSHCQITRGVIFTTHGGGQCVRDKHPDFDCFGKISVGNWTYIGANSIIMPGVSIGNNVLIAAGSIVTKSIPDCVVVGGNPAKILCTTEDFYKKNEKYDIHSKFLNPSEKKNLLTSPHSNRNIDISFIHKDLVN